VTTTPERTPVTLTKTRVEADMGAITQTIEELHRVQIKLQALFADLHDRREQLAADGISIDVELAPGVDAAYALWKQARAREHGREVEHEDQTVEGWPIK
jgi:hypothetical protein